VLRRSSRVQNKPPEIGLAEGVAYERRDGSVVLVNSAGHQMLAVQASAVQPSGPTRGDIKFETLNGAEKLDADFLKLLDIHSSPAKGVSKTKLPYTSNALEALSLEPEFCAKVVTKAAVHMEFFPRTDFLMIAVGDKSGQIGLWNINGLHSSDFVSVDEEDDTDGVMLLQPHRGYISGVRWSRTDPTQLYTCSYDGAVRRLDAHKGIFSEIYFSEEDEYSAFDLASDGNIAFAASNTGDLSVIDVRTNKLARASRSFHDRKINTVHVEPLSQHQIVTSSTDALVAVWDVRQMKVGAKPLLSYHHSKSCQGVMLCLRRTPW